VHEPTKSLYADWSSAFETVALASLMPITVLIVDDSRRIRLTIPRCIEQADLGIEEIVEADNGEEALARLSNHNVNLVLTAVNMPKMDAVQLLAELKRSEHWKAIPVLMITTEAGSKPVLDAVHRGASG
jgi:two-component system chemotaxis response regulator CheY